MSRPRFEQGRRALEKWHFHRGEAQRALKTKTQLAKYTQTPSQRDRQKVRQKVRQPDKTVSPKGP